MKFALVDDESELRRLAYQCHGAHEKNSRMFPALKKKLDTQKSIVAERKKYYAKALETFESDFPKIKR